LPDIREEDRESRQHFFVVSLELSGTVISVEHVVSFALEQIYWFEPVTSIRLLFVDVDQCR
jgi:hypothetical protein